MKYQIVLFIAICTWMLAACATPTPAPTPVPAPPAAPTAVPAADTADCTNLPAGGLKIKIENPWARGTESGIVASASSSAMAVGNNMSAGSSVGMSTGMGMNSSASAGMSTGMNMGSGIKTAVFMVIHNCAVQPDSLMKAMSNVDGTTSLMNWELREGKSVMFDVSQIDIPAGKKVALKSGGYHVMFNNLKKDLKPGDSVEVTLMFKNAGEIKITPPVKIP